MRRKKSVFVNGFAEAAPQEQSKAKTVTWFFSQKIEKKVNYFVDERQRADIMLNMIIERIRERIDKSGKSLNQIGRETGIDKAALSRIMQGGSCKVETADILLKHFGLTVSKKVKKRGSMKRMQKLAWVDKYHKGNWHSLATNPQAWLRSAEYLKEAADALHKSLWPAVRECKDTKAAAADHLYGPVYMLLAGLAVETLIKGIIVAKHPDFVEQQTLSGELTHHNLPDLYQTAGLMKVKGYDNLLLRLQNYVVIFGRYPVTKTKQDMQKLTDTRFAGQTDPDRIQRLWAFLVKKIQPSIHKEEKEAR